MATQVQHAETRRTARSRTAVKEPTTRERWHLDQERLTALGQEMATAATQQVRSSGTYWERCREVFMEAQTHNKAQEAVQELFAAGDKVEGRKAPWYRTYKSLLTACATRNIIVTVDMGMSQVQKLIKEHKQAEIESDPEAKSAKDEQMIEMFRRLAQGCLNRGIEKKVLAAVLKDVTPSE